MSIVTDKPLDVRAFTRDWAAFAAEVAVNRVLAGRLMRVVELALEQPADDLHADIIRGETRIVMGMVAAEVRARSEKANG